MAQKWTDERTELFRGMYDAGASYGVIGRKLSLTRSAVAGKVFRMKLPTRALVKGRPALDQPRVVVRRRLLRPTPAPVVVPRVPGRECDIWQLDRTRCRFPVGEPRTPEFHFCGQTPQARSPYCAEHHAITHVRVKR